VSNGLKKDEQQPTYPEVDPLLRMAFSQKVKDREKRGHCGEVRSQSVIHLSFMRLWRRDQSKKSRVSWE
jgi:hypothetical protein